MHCTFAQFFELMIDRQVAGTDRRWPQNVSNHTLDILAKHRDGCKKCLDDHLDRLRIVDPYSLDPYMSMTESYWLHSEGLEIVPIDGYLRALAK